MTVDPGRIECDFCGTDTRGGRVTGLISMMTEADFWRAVEQRAARFAGGLNQGDPGCDHCGGDGEIGSKGDLTEPCPCRRRR